MPMDLASAAAIAAPFVAKGAEAFSKTAGDRLAGKAAELLRAVSGKFKGDPYAEQTLVRAKEMPESEERIGMLSGILAEKMQSDHDFAEVICRLVNETKKNCTVQINNFSGQTVHGNQTVIDTVHGSVNIGDGIRDKGK